MRRDLSVQWTAVRPCDSDKVGASSLTFVLNCPGYKHISIGTDGLFYISEGGVEGLSPRVSIMDKDGNVMARWDALSAHVSGVDGQGDRYMALGARERVDKYVRL